MRCTLLRYFCDKLVNKLIHFMESLSIFWYSSRYEVPAIIEKLSKRCQKDIKKLSKTKKYQKPFKNISKRYHKSSNPKMAQKPLNFFPKRCQKPIQFQKGIKKLSNMSSKRGQILSFNRFLSPSWPKAKAQGHEQYVKTVLRYKLFLLKKALGIMYNSSNCKT